MRVEHSPSPLERVVQYLVVHRLAGNDSVLQAIHDVLVNEESPSRVAARYGFPKLRVRGFVQRVVEKTGSRRRARVLVSRALPIVVRVVQPIVVDGRSGGAVCRLCLAVDPDSARFPNDVVDRADHVRKAHLGLVDVFVGRVIEEMVRVYG